jgi:hypothetical protein
MADLFVQWKDIFDANLHVHVGNDLELTRICRGSIRKQASFEPWPLECRRFNQVGRTPPAPFLQGENRAGDQIRRLPALAHEGGKYEAEQRDAHPSCLTFGPLDRLSKAMPSALRAENAILQ